MIRCGFYPDNCVLNNAVTCNGDNCDKFDLCYPVLGLWTAEGREFPMECLFERGMICKRIECRRYLVCPDACHLMVPDE